MDNSDEDIRVSTSKKKLKASIEKDYEMDNLEWEVRSHSIALVENGEDVYDEIGVIMKAKVIE
jgi:hypothetical protein